MATNSTFPIDVYALINSVFKQATGREDLTATDTSSFVTVGETLLRTGYENTMNALSLVLARTIFSARPYKSKFDIMRVSGERWGAITRKIIPLSMDFEQSQDWNTDINPAQINDGESVDMYPINQPKAIELDFYGTKVLQKHITRFVDQLSQAFTSEGEFMNFIDAVMIEVNNDIESMNEARARITALNYIAGIESMQTNVVDLVAEYNTRYATKYTRAELLGTHIESFMKFVSSQIKIWSDRLTNRTGLYHANIADKPAILRHTPKARQRMLMYNPMFVEAEAMVYSSLFNPQYLEIGDFEGVDYWQDPKDPTRVNIKPSIMDVTNGHSKVADAAVNMPFVLGLLYDEEGAGFYPQFDNVLTTPVNAAGQYWNTYYHWRFNSYNDFTENHVLFVLGTGGANSEIIEA